MQVDSEQKLLGPHHQLSQVGPLVAHHHDEAQGGQGLSARVQTQEHLPHVDEVLHRGLHHALAQPLEGPPEPLAPRHIPPHPPHRHPQQIRAHEHQFARRR